MLVLRPANPLEVLSPQYQGWYYLPVPCLRTETSGCIFQYAPTYVYKPARGQRLRWAPPLPEEAAEEEGVMLPWSFFIKMVLPSRFNFGRRPCSTLELAGGHVDRQPGLIFFAVSCLLGVCPFLWISRAAYLAAGSLWQCWVVFRSCRVWVSESRAPEFLEFLINSSVYSAGEFGKNMTTLLWQSISCWTVIFFKKDLLT